MPLTYLGWLKHKPNCKEIPKDLFTLNERVTKGQMRFIVKMMQIGAKNPNFMSTVMGPNLEMTHKESD